ncbi:unnamed protein product [Rotaria magnacalcarata]|nr:unnamed protein product [Rotaria magnacalcarata]
MNLFLDILRNLKILRDIWLQCVENNRKTFHRSSIPSSHNHDKMNTKNSIERTQAFPPPLQQTKGNSDLFKNISTCLNDLVNAQQTNRNKYSRCSSPPRLFNETRQTMPSKKQK